jgi:hypothetical protein
MMIIMQPGMPSIEWTARASMASAFRLSPPVSFKVLIPSKRREEVAGGLPRTTSAGLAENTVTGKKKISEIWQMSLQMS